LAALAAALRFLRLTGAPSAFCARFWMARRLRSTVPLAALVRARQLLDLALELAIFLISCATRVELLDQLMTADSAHAWHQRQYNRGSTDACSLAGFR